MYKINLRNRAFYTSSFQKQVFLAYLSQSLGFEILRRDQLKQLRIFKWCGYIQGWHGYVKVRQLNWKKKHFCQGGNTQ